MQVDLLLILYGIEVARCGSVVPHATNQFLAILSHEFTFFFFKKKKLKMFCSVLFCNSPVGCCCSGMPLQVHVLMDFSYFVVGGMQIAW